VVELELQNMNPEKEEMANAVRRMERQLDDHHKKMESLKVRWGKVRLNDFSVASLVALLLSLFSFSLPLFTNPFI